MNDSELIQLLAGTRTSHVFVCRIPQYHAELIGAVTTAVWLSRYTVCKQESKHKAHAVDLYGLAPIAIEQGFIRIQPPRHIIYVFHHTSNKLRSYRVAVKATKDGRELYLVSIHRQSKGDVRATYARTLSIDEWEVRRKVGPQQTPHSAPETGKTPAETRRGATAWGIAPCRLRRNPHLNPLDSHCQANITGSQKT